MGLPRKRKETRNSRRVDAILGYLIPLFLIALASYQQIKLGSVDKYILGGLLIFGLGAVGWRLDVLFESYMIMRYGSVAKQQEQESPPTEKKNVSKEASNGKSS